MPVHSGYEPVVFEDFGTVGTYDSGAFGAGWTAFDSPGNAGNGLRRTSAVSIVDSTAQPLLAGDPPTSNGTAAQIVASWDGTDITSGIVQWLAEPIQYGRVRFRAKATGDGTNQMSPVVLMWPLDDIWPAGGEIDMWEGFDARDDLNPMKAFLHWPDPSDPTLQTDAFAEIARYATPDMPYDALGTDWHTYEMVWLPDSITLTVDDLHSFTYTVADNIPSGPMKFSIQLDAWTNLALSGDVHMWVDWVSVEQAVFFDPPASFPDADLDTTIEMAFQPAGTSTEARAWTDVTDRREQQAISLSRGRSDESSQTRPTAWSFALNNNDGALTPGNAASPYHPHVHRGIHARLSVGAGDRTALALPGGTGNYASTPDAAALDITGDVDIRIRLQPDRWATSGGFIAQRLVNKWAPGDLSFGAALFNAGAMVADWSTDGTTGLVQFGARLFAALHPIWIAQTIDVDDGAGGHIVSWYTWDGDTPPASVADWELAETYTRAGTTSINAGAGALEVGSRLNGAEGFQGLIFAVEVRDGINGTLVAAPDFSAQPAGTTLFTDSVGREWTVHGTAEISSRAVRAVGTVDSLELTWPHGDHNAASSEPSDSVASFTVAGILRRLSQGERPLRSSLYRHVTSPQQLPSVLGYWPCEDADQSVHLASGIPDTTEIISINDEIDTANDDSLAGAAALPNIAAGELGQWTGTVPIAGPATAWAVELVFKIPTLETSPTRTQLIEAGTAGTAARWILSISDSDMNLRVENAGSGVLVDNTAGFSGLADTWVIARIEATQNGGNIDWTWSTTDIDTGAGGSVSGSFAGTLGRVTTVANTTTGPPQGMSFGHIIVTDGTRAPGWLAGADTAWVGESAAHRFWRLCEEEGIECEVIGDPTANQTLRGDLTFSEPMGPQTRSAFLDLLRECVEVESGILLERRRAPGLVFRTRRSLEAQPVGLGLDAAVYGELDNPFVPVLDDQRLRNDITVSTVGGSSARALDQDSIDTEGTYEVDISIAGVGGLDIQNAILGQQPGLTEYVAGQNLHQARRRLALAVTTQLRYPEVAFDLGVADHKIPDWFDLEIGDRVTVVNLPEQHPQAEVELLVEHIAEKLSPRNWRPLLTCSPGAHWLSPWPPITAASGPLAVAAVSPAAVGVDPQAVTNPIQGTGHDLIAIAAATGPANEGIPPAAWVAPPGSTQVLLYDGNEFVSRVAVWTFTEDGAASYTFGFDTTGGNPCTCLLVGLDGTASVVFASAVLAPGGVTSNPYPPLATQVDDLAIPVAVSQVGDEMTAGPTPPADWAEHFDNTGTQNPRGIAVHSGRAVGSVTTPGASTWDASAGAHIQFVVGARGSGAGGTGNQRIPTSEWTAYIDPTDASTYGPTRTNGQLITAGNGFNTGDTVDFLQRGAGYNLSFDAFNEIHSFAMDDGDTLRLGARDTAGLFNTNKALRLKHQFDNNDPFGGVAGYQFQPTLENTTVGPNRSDRLFFDGTRTQYAMIPDPALGGGNAANDPKAIRASFGGATGDRVLQASFFKIEPWMLANNLAVAGGGSHASGAAQSPWTHFFGKGQFELFTRETDNGLAWPSSGGTAWSATTRHVEPVLASDVGSWWAIVSDYIIDPLDGHLHVWLAKGGAGFNQIVGLDGGSPAERWGLSYADTDPNQSLWYVQLANFYAFRNTNAPVATNNHDDSIGNVREIEYGGSGVFVSPSTRTAADLQSHCNYFLQG